jgi:DMSO/TMAO reductase YedYZ heme-binding membrane subunit
MASDDMNTRHVVLRHVGMAGLSALLVYGIYQSYSAWGVQPALWPDWGQDHPYWRAWGHAAFVLLFLTLILSPASVLWRPVKRLLPWRRELGIWFAVLSLGHGYAIWDRWARWDVATLFGFEYVADLERYVLVRPEVGIMNMMGLIMLPMVILLLATSSDRAVSLLGGSSWKWIHRTLVPVIFYVAMLRGTLYFFHFFQTTPPDWRVYPSIWFLYVFLGMGTVAVLVQGVAFGATVLRRRRQRHENGVVATVAVSGVVVLFVMPLALMTATVAYFDGRALESNPMLLIGQQEPRGGTPAPPEYAQSFEMVIHVEDEDHRIWVRDLDDAPYTRVTTKRAGVVVAQQIYRHDERMLYIAEQGPGSELTWSRTDGVEPEAIGLPHAFVEPGAWATQFGPGEHRIPAPQGELHVTIHTVDEPIADQVFEVPDGTGRDFRP